MRGLAAPRSALLRSALREEDPVRQGAGGLHEREGREYRAGKEDQAEQTHRGPMSVQDEPNPERGLWFPLAAGADYLRASGAGVRR